MYQIIKIDKNSSFDQTHQLTEDLEKLDRQIQITIQAILQAHIVRIRSILFKKNNIFDSFQKKIVESKANNSAQWHQKQLFILIKDRKELENKFNKLTGRTFTRRINIYLGKLSLVLTFIIFSFLIIICLFTAIYLIPFLAIFALVAITLKKL